MSKYKVITPKPGASDETGTDVRLYCADEIVDADQPWKKAMMDAFVENGWAIEIKAVEPEAIAIPEVSEVKESDEAEPVQAPVKKRGRPAKKPAI